MSTALFMERLGMAFTLACLFLLPWQTRYIFWAPAVGTTASEFGVISLYATMLLAGSAAMSWWIGKMLTIGSISRKNEGKKIGDNKYLLSFIFYLLSAVFFLITLPSPTHAWILNVGFSLLLGYATYKAAHRNIREALYAVFIGFIPVVGLGIWQMGAGWSPASTWLGLASRSAEHLGDSVILIEGQRILRMYGSFPHPNIFGTVIALMFGVVVTLSSRPRDALRGGGIFENLEQESRRSPLFPLGKLGVRVEMTYVLIPALITAVLFCTSRSAALAMACACITYLGLSCKNILQRRALFSIALLLPVLIWILQFISPSLLALRGQSFAEQQSISERVAQVEEWWQVMEQNGIWGTGIYQYPRALADIQGGSLPAWAYQPVHNVFLLVIAELGLFWCVVVGVGLLGVGGWVWGMEMRKKEYQIKNTTHFKLLTPNFITSLLPLFITIHSLSWFDHALWTSWSGMSYIAVAIALVFAGEQSRISTLSQGVLDEKK